MDAIHEFIKFINGYLWGPPMLALLFGTHIFLTLRLRGIQHYIFLAIKLSVQKDDSGH